MTTVVVCLIVALVAVCLISAWLIDATFEQLRREQAEIRRIKGNPPEAPKDRKSPSRAD